MITELKILEDKVTLFKDENINVISSVLDIKDISKNTNSYTQSFTVPADANNNRIFNYWFEASVNNEFDARRKVASSIFLDGQLFKVGFIQLQKVNIKQNKAASYTINFSGNLSGIAKAAGDLKLKDLDLSAFDHAYDSATVYAGLIGSVTTGISGPITSGDVIYSPIVKKQYFISGAGDNTSTDTLQNISFDGGTNTGIIWDDCNPSIKLIRLIEAIEIKLGITFSRHFFDTTEFTGLYMWLNASQEKEIKGNTQVIDWDTNFAGEFGTANNFMNLTTNEASLNTSAAINEYWDFVYIQILFEPGFLNIPFTINVKDAGEIIRTIEVPAQGTNTGWSKSSITKWRCFKRHCRNSKQY